MPPGERGAARPGPHAPPAAACGRGWLFTPGDPRRLAAVRIGLGALLAARLASGPYPELATQPAALFRPISFLRLLERMPSPRPWPCSSRSLWPRPCWPPSAC